MRRVVLALAGIYRRWRFVEERPQEAVPPGERPSESEPERLRRALEREERLLEDYRRSGCPALARERETTVRSLKNRLAALQLSTGGK